MPKLRKFLYGCFGYATFLYFLASVLTVKGFVHSLFTGPLNRIHHQPSLRMLAIVLAALSQLVRATPVILTVVNGMAWWTFKTGRPSARRWALTASASIVLASVLLLVAAIRMQRYGAHGHPNGLFLLVNVHLFVGLAGFVEFAKLDPRNKTFLKAGPPRISGDGTNKVFDALALIVQLGGVAVGMSLYMGWSRSHHLAIVRGYLSLLQVAIVLLVVTVIHESAHALTGLALGMRLRAFIIGPFQWRNADDRWNFKFLPGQFMAVSGAAGLVPARPDQSRWIEIATIAAGPLSNLLSGAIAVEVALYAQGKPYEPLWEFFALFATISLVTFAANLIPFRPDSLYSDGARIYQILRGGPLADYHKTVAILCSTLVTPLRPKDYDIHAIQRASAHFTSGPRALRLRFLAARHYFDQSRYAESSVALAEAERIYYREPDSDIPAEICSAVVISVLLPNRDADAARRWWRRLGSQTPEQLNPDYWLAKCAFHWAEHDPAAAREAWNTGQAYLEKLPGSGSCNYDRDCYVRMQEVLAAAPGEASAEAGEAVGAQLPSIEALPTPVFE